ncbi:mitogen-activated protein kinase 13-like isoform X2 [Apium graveolens]|uniref:mitogen-activated protein kinase 13-like isoform X2 n=1 Tax=Apium graveolens TaxID=4045 RepID=UPI003D7ACBB9
MQRDHPSRVKTYDNFIGYGDVDRYKNLEYIGQGSYGIVYSATDIYTNEKVAIKKISDVFRDVPRAVKVLREIKLLRLLQHPNIVEIKSIFIPPSIDAFNDIFVVLEYMDSDLHKVIASIDNLAAKDCRSFMFQILHAVKFMHAANVYHLDLKPGNILANCNGLIKVCDFGLSRVAFSEPSKEWHHTGYVGTRSYRAPEICGSELSKYPYAVDIWSIGCIFAEIMTGKPLFPWKTLASQLDLITNLVGTPSADTISGIRNDTVRNYLRKMQIKSPAPFSKRFQKSSPLALRLLQKLLAFDPKDRPTAEEALADEYFSGLRETQSRPSYQISRDEFAFENCSMSDMEVRRLMYQEILEQHSQLLRKDLPQGQLVCYAPVYYHPEYEYKLVYGGTSWRVNPPAIEDISLLWPVTGEACNARPSLCEPTAHPPYACSSRNDTGDFTQNPVPLQQSLLPNEHSRRNVTGESIQNQVPQCPIFPGRASRPSNSINMNHEKSVIEEGNRESSLDRLLEELNIKPFIRKEEEKYGGLGLPYANSSRNVTRDSVQNQVPPRPVFASTASRPNKDANQVNAVTEGNTEALLRQLPKSSRPYGRKEDKQHRELRR